MPMHWTQYFAGKRKAPKFLERYATAKSTAPKKSPTGKAAQRLVCRCAAPPKAAAPAVKLAAVLSILASTIGGEVDADAPLMEAGLDSLGAVELKNRLQEEAGDEQLPSTLVFDYPTGRKIHGLLCEMMPQGAANDDAAGIVCTPRHPYYAWLSSRVL